jgi:MFS family permease
VEAGVSLSGNQRDVGGLYYGWVITFAMFLVVFLFWGTFYSFGVFFKPLAADFGWGRAATSGPFSLSMLVQGLMGIGAGLLADRVSPRGIIGVGGVVTAIGYMLMSRMTGLLEFYLYFGVLVAAGMSVSYVVPVAVIPRWFEARRGLALGIAMAGVGAGNMVFPPLFTQLIGAHGWRTTYLLLGIGIGVVSVAVSLLLRPAPIPEEAMVGLSRDFSLMRAMATPAFWLLGSIWILVAIPLQIMVVHLVNYATDVGVTATVAAFALTMMGLANMVSRIGVGSVSDRLGDKLTYYICLGLQAIVLLALMRAWGVMGFYAAGLLFGIGYGGGGVVYPKIVAGVFGVRFLGGIIGVLSFAWYVGAAFGAPMAGFIFDRTSSYQGAFLVGGLIMAVATVLVSVLFRLRHTLKAQVPAP